MALLVCRQKQKPEPYGYGSIPINTIFRRMNIHLPAILMLTTGVQGFDTLPNGDLTGGDIEH